jgi:hypothetical protein
MKLVIFCLTMSALSMCTPALHPKNSTTTDTLIFGIQYGECQTNCVRLYQLTQHHLYRARHETYITDAFKQDFKWEPEPLSADKHAQANGGYFIFSHAPKYNVVNK